MKLRLLWNRGRNGIGRSRYETVRYDDRLGCKSEVVMGSF